MLAACTWARKQQTTKTPKTQVSFFDSFHVEGAKAIEHALPSRMHLVHHNVLRYATSPFPKVKNHYTKMTTGSIALVLSLFYHIVRSVLEGLHHHWHLDHRAVSSSSLAAAVECSKPPGSMGPTSNPRRREPRCSSLPPDAPCVRMFCRCESDSSNGAKYRRLRQITADGVCGRFAGLGTLVAQ